MEGRQMPAGNEFLQPGHPLPILLVNGDFKAVDVSYNHHAGCLDSLTNGMLRSYTILPGALFCLETTYRSTVPAEVLVAAHKG
jgi:hypothetical protein